MPFALTNNPSQSEISEAINYLLANFGANLSVDPNNGQITGSSGIVIAYFYKYLAVKYADSFDGTVNFSNSPTGRTYYGLRNTDSSVESTNPADYIWYQATGGFGTTKFLFYQTSGGRQINFVVATAAPDATYIKESGPAIDLDIVTTVTAYNTAAPSIYQWTSSSTPPTRPTTTSTYIWSGGTFIPPSGWSTAPTSNTNPGYYLWAITIPLVVSTNVTTSTLNWTNTSYPIYAFSYNGQNGSPGATGDNGLSAITAYKVQSQSAATPTFTTPTSGSTLPTGWYATLSLALAALSPPQTSVATGQVVWYLQGRYNSSGSSIGGVSPNTTAWTGPIAASVFQDIMSDNWVSGGGSVPPTYGIPSTYSTTGYYISRNTGNVWFNDGIFRGDINTDGDATFEGKNTATFQAIVNGVSYNIDYSSLSNAITTSVGKVRAGVVGYATSLGSQFNVGVLGVGNNGGGTEGIGVVGQGDTFGGFFSGDLAGLVAVATGTNNVAFQISSNGKFIWNGYTIPAPTGSTTTFLRNDGTWSPASGTGGGTVTSVSGTGSVSGLTLSGTVTTSGNLTLGGSLSLTAADLIATSPSSSYFLSGVGWIPVTVVNTLNGASGSVTNSFAANNSIPGITISVSGSGTNSVTYNFSSTSDRSLKKDIAPIDKGLDFVKQLNPVTYSWNTEHIAFNKKTYGLIANEVLDTTKEESSIVYTNTGGVFEGKLAVDYQSLVPVLIKAIQELTTKVEALEAQIKA